jgi:hypothetical protein
LRSAFVAYDAIAPEFASMPMLKVSGLRRARSYAYRPSPVACPQVDGYALIRRK